MFATQNIVKRYILFPFKKELIFFKDEIFKIPIHNECYSNKLTIKRVYFLSLITKIRYCFSLSIVLYF